MSARTRPRLAVWKFASCDGCQLSLLDPEDELLTLAAETEIANFPEASSAVSCGIHNFPGPRVFRVADRFLEPSASSARFASCARFGH